MLVLLTAPSARALLHPLPWSEEGGTGAWRSLAGVVGFFVWPPVFVALVVHTVSFRLQLLLVPFTVLQHLVFGLPLQLEAVEQLGLDQVVQQCCRSFYVILDSAYLVEAPHSAPAHCARGDPGFFLVYTYVLLAGVLPAQLLFWSERLHKRAFLVQARRQGGALGAAAAAAAAAKRWRQAPSLVTAALSTWVSSALAWSGIMLVCGLLASAARLRLRLAGPAPA